MLNTTEGSASSLDSGPVLGQIHLLFKYLFEKKILFVYQNLFTLVEKLLSSLSECDNESKYLLFCYQM